MDQPAAAEMLLHGNGIPVGSDAARVPGVGTTEARTPFNKGEETMAWLVAGAIVVVFFTFLHGHRKSALAIALVAVAAAVFVYRLDERTQHHATTRIKASDIALENVVLKPTFRASYDLSGTITNNSEKYRLDGLDFRVTLRDCKGKDASNCSVIGEASAFAGVTVPPGETGSFVASLYFGGDRPKAKGTFAWDYEITSITAKRQ